MLPGVVSRVRLERYLGFSDNGQIWLFLLSLQSGRRLFIADFYMHVSLVRRHEAVENLLGLFEQRYTFYHAMGT